MGECVNFFIALMSMISTGCIGGALHSTEFIDVNNQVWVAVGFVTLIAKFVICKTYIDEKEAAIRQKGHRDYAGVCEPCNVITSVVVSTISTGVVCGILCFFDIIDRHKSCWSFISMFMTIVQTWFWIVCSVHVEEDKLHGYGTLQC